MIVSNGSAQHKMVEGSDGCVLEKQPEGGSHDGSAVNLLMNKFQGVHEADAWQYICHTACTVQLEQAPM